MSNSSKTRFKSAFAGTVATFRQDMFGQFMPIGVATCALLQKGETVTIPALITEIKAADRTDLADRSIMHLQHTLKNIIKGK